MTPYVSELDRTVRSRRPACPTEDAEQEMLFRWAAGHESQHPELALLHHVPNGGHRSKRTASALRRQGVKPGVPDVVLPVARDGHHGLYVEMKRLQGGRVSPEQCAWIEALSSQGYRAVLCRGWEQARDAIVDYLAAEAGP